MTAAVGSAGDAQRCRLVVVADGIGEVVRGAGGFLCDRARAGWDVSVLVAGGCDLRPLTILGIAAQELGTDVAAAICSIPCTGALAVDAAVLARDARIRDAVSGLARRGLTEVTVWGRPAPAEIGRGLEPVAHPVSAAASAFKRHALLAAGGDADGAETSEETSEEASEETLFRPRRDAFRRLYAV